MKPLIKALTIVMDELERSLTFYRDGLGLQTNGVMRTEFNVMRPKAAFMFELQNGIILALYSRIALAKNIKQLVAPPSLTEFNIGHIVQYKQGVDEVLKQAEAAGTVVTEEPYEQPWDIYSGYFKYSDDHLWEIVWNPGWKAKDRRDILD